MHKQQLPVEVNPARNVLRNSLWDCGTDELRRKYIAAVKKLRTCFEEINKLKDEKDSFKRSMIPRETYDVLHVDFTQLQENYNELVCTSQARYQNLCKEKDEVISAKDDVINNLKLELRIFNNYEDPPDALSKADDKSRVNIKSPKTRKEKFKDKQTTPETAPLTLQNDFVTETPTDELSLLLDGICDEPVNDNQELLQEIEDIIQHVSENDENEDVRRYLDEMIVPNILSPMSVDTPSLVDNETQTDRVELNENWAQTLSKKFNESSAQTTCKKLSESSAQTACKNFEENSTQTLRDDEMETSWMLMDNNIGTLLDDTQMSLIDHNLTQMLLDDAQISTQTYVNNESQTCCVTEFNENSTQTFVSSCSIEVQTNVIVLKDNVTQVENRPKQSSVETQSYISTNIAVTQTDICELPIQSKSLCNRETQTDLKKEEKPISASVGNQTSPPPKNLILPYRNKGTLSYTSFLTPPCSCDDSSTKTPVFNKELLLRRDRRNMQKHLTVMKNRLNSVYKTKCNKYLRIIFMCLRFLTKSKKFAQDNTITGSILNDFLVTEEVDFDEYLHNYERRKESFKKVENWMQTLKPIGKSISSESKHKKIVTKLAKTKQKRSVKSTGFHEKSRDLFGSTSDISSNGELVSNKRKRSFDLDSKIAPKTKLAKIAPKAKLAKMESCSYGSTCSETTDESVCITNLGKKELISPLSDDSILTEKPSLNIVNKSASRVPFRNVSVNSTKTLTNKHVKTRNNPNVNNTIKKATTFTTKPVKTSINTINTVKTSTTKLGKTTSNNTIKTSTTKLANTDYASLISTGNSTISTKLEAPSMSFTETDSDVKIKPAKITFQNAGQSNISNDDLPTASPMKSRIFIRKLPKQSITHVDLMQLPLPSPKQPVILQDASAPAENVAQNVCILKDVNLKNCFTIANPSNVNVLPIRNVPEDNSCSVETYRKSPDDTPASSVLIGNQLIVPTGMKKVDKPAISKKTAENLLITLISFDFSRETELEIAKQFIGADSMIIARVIVDCILKTVHFQQGTRKIKRLYFSIIAHNKLLGFLCLLKEVKDDATCMSKILDLIESTIMQSNNNVFIIRLTEFYTAYCMLYSNVFRVRFFVVKALYKMGARVLPMLYYLITNWLAIFNEYKPEFNRESLLMRSVVQVIRIKQCSTEEYNVVKLLHQVKKYPDITENVEALLAELFSEYFDKPNICIKYIIIMLSRTLPIKQLYLIIENTILKKQNDLRLNEVKNVISCLEFIFAEFKKHTGITETLEELSKQFGIMAERASQL